MSVQDIKSYDEFLHWAQFVPTILVEAGASWCAPCRAFRPHFDKFAEAHPEVLCLYVDIELDDAFVEAWGIQHVPQLMLFKDGQYREHLESRTIVTLEREFNEAI